MKKSQIKYEHRVSNTTQEDKPHLHILSAMAYSNVPIDELDNLGNATCLSTSHVQCDGSYCKVKYITMRDKYIESLAKYPLRQRFKGPNKSSRKACSKVNNVMFNTPPTLALEMMEIGSTDAPVAVSNTIPIRQQQLASRKESRILVHGCYINSAPIQNRNESNFVETVHVALDAMGTEMCDVQAYSWPLIMNLCNVIIINSLESGKAMYYLPGLCSHLLDRELHKQHHVSNGSGPIGIILAPSAGVVDRVDDICHRILIDSDVKIVKAYCTEQNNKIFDLFNGCDLLITTPQFFIGILEHPAFNLERLLHLVLDGVVDVKFIKELEIVQKMCEDLRQRNKCTFLQKIVTADYWNPEVETIMYRDKPVLIVGAHLEAALYANVKIKGKIVQRNIKSCTLFNILTPDHLSQRVVIACANKEQVDQLANYLTLQCLTSIVAAEAMAEEAITRLRSLWLTSAHYRNPPLLLCTDELLRHLDITDASVLVHYSMPEMWTTFSERFSCMIDNFEDKLSPKLPKSTSKKIKCHSYILIDEDDSDHLARITSLMERLGKKLDTK